MTPEFVVGRPRDDRGRDARGGPPAGPRDRGDLLRLRPRRRRAACSGVTTLRSLFRARARRARSARSWRRASSRSSRRRSRGRSRRSSRSTRSSAARSSTTDGRMLGVILIKHAFDELLPEFRREAPCRDARRRLRARGSAASGCASASSSPSSVPGSSPPTSTTTPAGSRPTPRPARASGSRTLWIFVPLCLALIVVQEMSNRMGVVTGKGLSDLIRERFGVKVDLLPDARPARDQLRQHPGRVRRASPRPGRSSASRAS